MLLIGAERDAGGVGERAEGQRLEDLLGVALPGHDREQTALRAVDACGAWMIEFRMCRNACFLRRCNRSAYLSRRRARCP